MSLSRRHLLALGFASALPAAAAPSKSDHPILVFAAASLKNALDGAAAAWMQGTGGRVSVAYAGSNTLGRQIEQGAPADLFVSADRDWMDELAGQGLIQPATRLELLGNALVLIAPAGASAPFPMQPGLDLVPRLAGGRLAMANVDAVPAGKYGKAALEALGAWNGVQGRIAQTDNVRAALLLVSRGEAPLGIVYRSDAVADSNVVVLATFPENTHPPIVYPAALVASSTHPDAPAFLAWLHAPPARPFFERQGFAVLGKAASDS